MLAALTLCPLVAGAAWLFVAGIIVVSVMLSGIVARQLLHWWPGVAAAQALVLFLTVMVLFVRSRITEGPGAIGALTDLFSAAMKVTRDQAPPVEATQGIVLLVAGSAGLVALLVDLLATTLRQPALAGLPLLAVYCVPAALLEGGLRWYYFFAAASGFLLLLSADSSDRIHGWGRVLTAGPGGAGSRPARRGGSSGAPIDSSLARGGRRIAVTTMVMAIVVPALVPGLSNQIIGAAGDGGQGAGKGRTITRINPILDLRKDLVSLSNTKLLSYRTTVANPSPLRIVTSDVFDGNTWSPSTRPVPRDNLAQNGLPSPPGLSDGVKTEVARTSIKIGPLKETYLPLPYPTTKVVAAGTWLYDATTLNVIGDGKNTVGLSYQVTHLEVEPTAEQLADSPAPSHAVSSQYLALPKNLPAVITATAQAVAKTGTAYQQAVRLQRWFRDDGGFEYSTKTPDSNKSDSGDDAIVAFLARKRGYCVHFASAMAVMARTLGIPARVAVGFLPGERQPDGTMVISSHDAHAWPELYFEGVGWVRFEPTPRAGFTTTPEWSVPPSGVLPEDPESTQQPQATASAAPNATPTARARKDVPDQAAAAPTQASSGWAVPWPLILIALTVIIVLIAPWLAAQLSSRRRWRRARAAADGSALAEAAWSDLRLGLGDLGIRWAVSWTPQAVRQRLAGEYRLDPATRAALERLTTEIEDGRYAPPDQERGRPARDRMNDVAAVVSAVSALKSSRTRWLARLWPASGVATLSAFGPWMDSTTSRVGQQASGLGAQLRERGAQARDKISSRR